MTRIVHDLTFEINHTYIINKTQEGTIKPPRDKILGMMIDPK